LVVNTYVENSTSETPVSKVNEHIHSVRIEWWKTTSLWTM